MAEEQSGWAEASQAKGEHNVAIVPKPDLRSLTVDKEVLRRIVAEQDRLLGYLPDPTATAEKAIEKMRAEGIRPEDNIGSRAILRIRGEEQRRTSR
jgi:hypothetical protein